MRTSSAPPEEHGGGEIHKAHFQPTKTQQSFQSVIIALPNYYNIFVCYIYDMYIL